MRDAGATTRTRSTTTRANDASALDDVSDQLGEVLHHADELLAEWARFSAQVRARIDAEVAEVGGAVATAVDASVDRAVERTAASVDASVGRAIETRIGAQLGALSTELARLEQRARAAARLVSDERTRDRRLIWAVIGGVIVANILLAILVLRGPAPAPAPAPAVEPAPAPAVEPVPAAPATTPGDGSAATVAPSTVDPAATTVPAGAGSGDVGSAAPTTVADPAAGSGAPGGDGSAAPVPSHTKVKAGTVPRPKHPRSK